MKAASILRFASMALVTVSVAGCSSLPLPMLLKDQDVPTAWSEPVIADGNVWPTLEWWREFQSPELDSLILTARSDNLDLAAAAARILQSEAQTNIARAAQFPVVSIGGAAQNQGAVESGSSVNNTLASLTGQISYEFDFWNLARHNMRAAEALLRSERYAQETVALSVTANAASSFFEILALRERISIASQNLATARRVLDAIERLTANGLSSPLDLAQQQALVAGQAAIIPALEAQERQGLYNLALLLGRAPEGFTVAPANLAGIVAPRIGAGLPRDLLTRRPDVAQAEASLAAANANMNAARATFFPNIALIASAGAATGPLSAVAEGSAVGEFSAAAGGTGLIYGAGISLLQTIFDGGRRQGQLDLTKAQQEELIVNYRAAVFRAFSEVEIALVQSSRVATQEGLKGEQVERAATAFDISNVQYREGLIDLLALLQAQQTLFSAQDELVEIKLARLQAAINLYKALGGGWSSSADKISQ